MLLPIIQNIINNNGLLIDKTTYFREQNLT